MWDVLSSRLSLVALSVSLAVPPRKELQQPGLPTCLHGRQAVYTMSVYGNFKFRYGYRNPSMVARVPGTPIPHPASFQALRCPSAGPHTLSSALCTAGLFGQRPSTSECRISLGMGYSALARLFLPSLSDMRFECTGSPLAGTDMPSDLPCQSKSVSRPPVLQNPCRGHPSIVAFHRTTRGRRLLLGPDARLR